MNLLKIKDCSQCMHALVYGSSDNKTIECVSNNPESLKLFEDNDRCSAIYCKDFIPCKVKRSGSMDQNQMLKFMLAGDSEFILNSTKTGDDFRFKLKRADKNNMFFVNLVKASQKIYCGTMWFDKKTKEFKYSQGKKGNVSGNSVDIRSLLFIVNKLYNEQLVTNLEAYSIGKCGCCGKVLDTEEEMKSGIHNACKKLIDYSFMYE